jgi:hypothetical protein
MHHENKFAYVNKQNAAKTVNLKLRCSENRISNLAG